MGDRREVERAERMLARARVRLVRARMQPPEHVKSCLVCGREVRSKGQGRPGVLCKTGPCKKEWRKRYQRVWHQANKEAREGARA